MAGEGEVIRRRVVVSGSVPGVGFRWSCAEAARRRGLGGWVRNRRDGRVEAVFEGPAGAVAAMVDWCRTGPRAARVDALEVSEEEPEGVSAFRVSATG